MASTSTGRKAVELKPAPRKVSATSTQPASSKPIVQMAASPPSTSTRSAKESTSGQPNHPSISPPMPTPEPSAGIFKTVADIDEAPQSGVPKSVPPGTQGWRLTYHEFKELVKFYFFGVKKLAVEHRRAAAAIRRKGKVNRTRRKNEFVRTYRVDLLR